MLTQRFAQGLELAVRAHDGQVRKGTSIPYIAHPWALHPSLWNTEPMRTKQ